MPSGTRARPGGSLSDLFPGGLGGVLGGAAAGSVLSGGLGNLIKELQDNGHGRAPQSWVGTGPNEEIAPKDLANALGSDTLNALSKQTGLSVDDLLAGLTQHLAGLGRSAHPKRALADPRGGGADGIGSNPAQGAHRNPSPVPSCFLLLRTAIRGRSKRPRFPLLSRGLQGRSPASGCAAAPVFLLYFTGKNRKASLQQEGIAGACRFSPRSAPTATNESPWRINAPGSRIPRSAERRSFAVPSGSGQIVREYRKWVAARFRLSAFDGTPARCRCD